MTLLQFEIFQAVVETGSFTKAGEILGLTQSAVSHAIAALESEFGLSLLNRNRTGIFLTETGEKLLFNIREILNHAEQIKQKVSEMQGIITGTIRIGCFSTVAAKLLPGILKQFSSNYPAVQIQLLEGSYTEMEKWIASGIVDLGFVLLPNKELEVTPLIQDEYVVLLPENHRLKGRSFIQIDEIAHEPFIMPLAGCEMFVNKAFKQIKAKPNVLFEVEHSNTILAMVKNGLGISIVPELIFQPPGVFTASLKPKLFRKIGLGVRSAQSAAPATKIFITTAKNWVKRGVINVGEF
ncbi:LysR family transcriptional regulator [Candidatus Formimonas warabiya]|uniref:HTH lysR-type domain-containing protein n=1 Tax=Formimonas warabiya TaxID=1761012 RepID=A0A3G1L012_FORW1|nr:LysR family transcriptional regulator [Candidatus Formimonas warabiya]ATW27988.1 hypothetical protein DCMF_27435 [Candidatus Formimonas warabiya]